MIASRNDPFGSYDHAGDIANAWGSMLISLLSALLMAGAARIVMELARVFV